MRRSEIETRLDGSPLELRGGSGRYEIHNIYDPENTLRSKHKTLAEVSDRVTLLLGK